MFLDVLGSSAHADGEQTINHNPNWKLYPSAETFGITAEKNLTLAKKLTFINSLKIAKDLKKLGIQSVKTFITIG